MLALPAPAYNYPPAPAYNYPPVQWFGPSAHSTAPALHMPMASSAAVSPPPGTWFFPSSDATSSNFLGLSASLTDSVSCISPSNFGSLRLFLETYVPFSGSCSPVGKPDDVMYELSQAHETTIPYNLPAMGTFLVSAIRDEDWHSVDLFATNTLQNRKQWLLPLLAKVKDVTYTLFEQARGDLMRLFPANAVVSDIAIKPLLTFLHAVIVNGLRIPDIFSAATCHRMDDTVLWLIRSEAFPGPVTAHLEGHADFSHYTFWHIAGVEAVFGIMNTGFVLPTTNDGICLPDDLPVQGFFARVRHFGSPISHSDLVAESLKLHKHPKNVCGVAFSGKIFGAHVKTNRSSTWLESFLVPKAGLVKSASTDKRWCMRMDLPRITHVCLTSSALSA